MSLSQISYPKFQAVGPNGPLSGYLVYTYVTGTTTLSSTWLALAGGDGNLNANPIVLDSNGEAVVFLDQSINYKFVIKHPTTLATHETIDPVIPISNPSSGQLDLFGNLNIKNYSIVDNALVPYFTFTTTASAVNSILVRNAATGSGPTLTAQGSDTNIDITLRGKGTGLPLFPDGAKIGGVALSGTAAAGKVWVASSSTAAAWDYVTRIGGVTISGTPSSGMVPVASSSSAAAWATPITTIISGITVNEGASTGYVLTATSSSAATFQIRPDELGPNLVTNGRFRISQLATSWSAVTTADVHLADRWLYIGAATSKADISVVARTGGLSAWLQVVTYASGSFPGTVVIAQVIPVNSTGTLLGKYLTVSFDISSPDDYQGTVSVKATCAGTADTSANYLAALNPTAAENATASGAPAGSLARYWGTSSSAITYTGSGIWLTISIPPAATAKTVQISNIQVQLSNTSRAAGGHTVPVYQDVPYSDELNECKRFYQKSFLIATAPAQNAGATTGEVIFLATAAGAAQDNSPMVQFPVEMKSTPTLTLYNPSAASAQVRDESAAVNCTAAGTYNSTTRGFLVYCTGNAATAVNNLLGFHYVADSRLP